MKFVRVEMLYLVWIIPICGAFFWYGFKRRQRILHQFSSPTGLAAMAPGISAHRRLMKAGLILTGLLLLAGALSGPQYGYQWKEVQRKGVDLIIALDCSRSMLADDIKPTRLDRAKREIIDLLELLQGDRIGLVAFAGTAFLQCPLTMDYQGFYIFLNSLTPDFLPVGGTDLAAAIKTTMEAFDPQTHSDKAIILITDGEDTRKGNPIRMAEKAAQNDIKLFSIGIGREVGVPVPDAQGGFKKDAAGNIVLTRLDEALLKRLAATTGGSYVRSVAGDMDLEMIYSQEIRSKMERATLASGRKQIWEDRYQWLLVVALACLVTELLIPVRKHAAALMAAGVLLGGAAVPGAYGGSFEEGLKAYEQEDYQTALKHFIDAQIDAPDTPQILYNLGNTYYKIGDYPSAQKYYQQTAESDQQQLRPQSVFNLGNAAYRQGKLEEAIEHYKKALELTPEDQAAKENLAFVQKQLQQQRQQKNSSGSNGKEAPQDRQPSDQKEAPDGTSSSDPPQPPEAPEQENGAPKNEAEQHPSPTEYGNQMNASQAPEPPPQDGSGQKQAEQLQRPPENVGTAGQSNPDTGAMQAEKMLNRLKDQPGRATMPLYQQRAVEKDW